MTVNHLNECFCKINIGSEKMYLNRLEEIRIDHDNLQKEIAYELNITKQQYSLYETGKRTIPIEKLIKIADIYNVSLDWLCNRTNKKEVNR